ncbi:hypothetical protein BESB_080430 [Besnoitia besnoiti]|uniref:Uncharacterized protein n=1 Tax=Besnoitia besnoiti TaxID=94643 RepID=A0A2A9MDX0_BESBE|nr:hypothetical protein BESB_080430 [Besnoitia besnoiti]PFH33827.1 hypothetical protein BESB_080430 [Besnoitia besnoiti]
MACASVASKLPALVRGSLATPTASLFRASSAAACRVFNRPFSGYDGQPVTSEQLIKKSDDWVIEETNFCLGRTAPLRFKETDDLAHRVLHVMDSQLAKMHTRLRDGTCIPVMGLYILDVVDKPTPLHQFVEAPLLKWTWDHTYSEAYEDKPTAPAAGKQ